jgi:DMSO/TMAO reductase YedYZ molybdopterin-dependent catalytic subunit
VKIEVKDSLPAQTQGAAKPTTSFNVAGSVAKAGTIDLAKLNAMKQSTVSITAGSVTTVYGGVLLSDFLQDAGIKLDVNKKNDILTKGIVGVGSDGYAALIVGGETDAKFGNLQILIATTKDGQPLGDQDGFARIVVPGDGRAGRYVSNLTRIEVVEL